ncbi:hypothetical protein GCM10011415_01900 [Salipiger pallidus]|uniref:Lipid/polyisoprenoid-binding YceI-like domain-containing protein n=1 Tax=Salipiger pallidus TaxID=1775170 RepID=A0A8J2ZG07_9RHOB|nr:YceI family protein [Salipiger pallidus]GGG59622.1 hypothetical protein GCM10011415_01900 [Salipiger pallidus]
MKSLLLAGLVAAAPLAANAAAESYTLDSSHSQIVFSYNHLGYSTGFGMYSGFEGDISYDAEDPAASSVEVSFPVNSMITGWEPRKEHFMGDDFFGASDEDMVTFTSTSINVTGENTAEITGDLTLNGTTKEVVLDTQLTQAGEHPMEGKPWLGFFATTTLLRSDYGVDMFAPYVSDEVEVQISIEAMKAE